MYLVDAFESFNSHYGIVILCDSKIEKFDTYKFLVWPQVCEHAYSLAQNLDPNSEGRGVLQFKTGLMSVIKV